MEAQGTRTPRPPWHLWLVGIAGGLWSAMSAVSFLLTQLNVEAVMSRFPPEQREYFASWPLWADACGAVGVGGGVIGCLLLLRTSRLAYPAFLASMIGAGVANLGGLVLLGGIEALGGTSAVGLTAVPIVVAAGLALYARAMRTRGVLR